MLERSLATEYVPSLLDVSVPATSFQSRMRKSVASTTILLPSCEMIDSDAGVLGGNASRTVRTCAGLSSAEVL